MDVDTFLKLSKHEKMAEFNKRDHIVSDFLIRVEEGEIALVGSAGYDQLWTAEHLKGMLSAARGSISRMSDFYEYNPLELHITAALTLQTFNLVDVFAQELRL